MDYDTREIVDVFHGYANTSISDFYSRNHIHGLNPKFLKKEGHETPCHLIDSFHQWLKSKTYVHLFANCPGKEIRELQLFISDIRLDPWKMRCYKPYHEIAYYFKKFNIPICSTSRCDEAHSVYRSANCRPFNLSDAARKRHGHHCSLYDCYELYLFYVTNM